MKMISEHISYAEAVKSPSAIRHGIDNTPFPSALAAMSVVASMCFEPVRKHFGVPIYISSFYRCPELNEIEKGSPTSDHMAGRSIDMDADVYGHVTNKDIFDYIRLNLDFDQLIWEYGDDHNPAWVHVSYRSSKTNRKMILKTTSKGQSPWK